VLSGAARRRSPSDRERRRFLHVATFVDIA